MARIKTSMVVCDLYLLGVTAIPTKANAELVVDADRMLTLAVPRQRFQPVPGRCCQVNQFGGVLDHENVALSGTDQIRRKTLRGLTARYR
jgi:hypothetical protein